MTGGALPPVNCRHQVSAQHRSGLHVAPRVLGRVLDVPGQPGGRVAANCVEHALLRLGNHARACVGHSCRCGCRFQTGRCLRSGPPGQRPSAGLPSATLIRRTRRHLRRRRTPPESGRQSRPGCPAAPVWRSAGSLPRPRVGVSLGRGAQPQRVATRAARRRQHVRQVRRPVSADSRKMQPQPRSVVTCTVYDTRSARTW